jgi:hypothetical protein
MLSKFIRESDKRFEEILGKEMEGILIMSSKQRFDMCEKMLSKNGKLKSFLHSEFSRLWEEFNN